MQQLAHFFKKLKIFLISVVFFLYIDIMYKGFTKNSVQKLRRKIYVKENCNISKWWRCSRF